MFDYLYICSRMEEIFPDEFCGGPNEENNFPLWVDGVDTSFAPFLPTPLSRVREALNLAKVKEGDGIVDLGCGDGRFCLVAIREFGADFARGYDSDSEAIHRAIESAEFLREQNRVSFEQRDFDDASFLEKIVKDEFISVLVTVLTPDFQKKHSSFIRDFLDQDDKRRIVSVFFNLDNIQGVQRCAATDKIFVYSKTRTD